MYVLIAVFICSLSETDLKNGTICYALQWHMNYTVKTN